MHMQNQYCITPPLVKIAYLILALLLLPPLIIANDTRFELNAPIKGFKIPSFGPSGYKQWDLQGSQGLYLDDKTFQVQDMTLRTFSEDEDASIELVIQSPHACIALNDNAAKSSQSIYIQGPGYEASGKVWDWLGSSHTILIHEDVHVVFENKALDSSIIPKDASSPETNTCTTVSSTSLRLVEGKTQDDFYFKDKVCIKGENFTVRCDTLHVVATNEKEGKNKHTLKIGSLEKMLATGNVVIQQENAKASSSQAELFPKEEKIVLTGNPILEDERGKAQGEKITFSKGQKQAIVESQTQNKRPSLTLRQPEE